MALLKRHAAAEVMEHFANHSIHGYDQAYRGGDGGWETITLSDGNKIKIATGDRDCSKGVIDAYQAVGINCGGATYTGNMSAKMVATGNFKRQSASFKAERGDTYLNDANHTAMCLGGGKLAQFGINEKGTVTGGKVGDQTGNECKIMPYYSYPWNCVLECVNNEYMPQIARDTTIQDIDFSKYQLWHPDWIDKTWFYLTNVATGMNLDIANAGKSVGTPVRVAKKDKTNGQVFRLKRQVNKEIGYSPAPLAPCELIPKCAPKLSVTLLHHDLHNGNGVALSAVRGLRTQGFTVVDFGNGNWLLLNPVSHRALGVAK